MHTTVTITGEHGAGMALLADAIRKLLANRGLHTVQEDAGAAYDALVYDFGADDEEALLAFAATPEKAPVLDLSVPDIFGNRPPQNLVGRTFRHTGNGKVYEVQALVWMGEDDVWGFLHREANNPVGVPLVRPLSHLGGRRADGTQRYEEVERNPFHAFLVEGHGLEFIPPSVANMLRALSDATLTGVVVRDVNRLEAHYQDRPGHVVLETNAAFDVSEDRRIKELLALVPDDFTVGVEL